MGEPQQVIRCTDWPRFDAKKVAVNVFSFASLFFLFLRYYVISFFLSIDTESIKFRSSSQVWWVAKF